MIDLLRVTQSLISGQDGVERAQNLLTELLLDLFQRLAENFGNIVRATVQVLHE